MADFVGRVPELTMLRSAVDTARSGRGGLVLVSGEPGIGKTRLAEEACDYASSSGATVLWGRCLELEGMPAYWPWIQVLRELVADPSRAALISGAGEAAAEVSRLVPEILGSAGDEHRRPRDAADRFRLLDAFTQLLRMASSRHSLVVVLDDLHWCDRPSLDLLRHLSAQLHDLPLLVIANYRDAELGRRHPLTAMLPQLTRERGAHRTTLTGLGVDDVSRLLAAAGATSAPRRLAATLQEQTGGNPFFVGELARLLLEQGDLGQSGVPQGVREVIRRRLDTLSRQCNRVLPVGAVLGRDFDLALVIETARLPVDAVLAVMDEAVAAGLLIGRRDPPGRYSFVHDLIRESLYQELPTALRVQLHRRAAETLERHDGSLVALAYHWFEASPATGGERAAWYASQAAAQAMEQAGYEEAARLYRMALDSLAVSPAEELRRCQLLLDLAEAEYRSGELVASLDSCSTAAEVACSLHRADLQARAALVLQGVDDHWLLPTLRQLCEVALRAVGDEHPALRARLLGQLAILTGSTGQAEALESLSREALDLAQRAQDIEASIAAVQARHAATTGPDGVGERLALAGRLIELGAHSGRPVEAVWGHFWRTDALFQLGDLPGVPGELLELELLVERLKRPLFQWHLLKCRAALAQVTGRFDDALHLTEQSVASVRASQHPVAEHLALAFRALVSFDRGSPEEMEKFIASVDRARAPDPRIASPTVLSLVTTFELALGRDDGARQRFGQLMAGYARVRKADTWLLLTDRLAEAAVELGSDEQRQLLYETLTPYSSYFAADGAGVTWCRGSVARPLGLLAAALGRLDDAERHLERAVKVNRLAGAIPFAAYSELSLAEVLTRKSSFGRARELARAASQTAARLGMDPLQQRAARLLTELTRAGPRLSRRQQEIAGLVARGLSNREIAKTLHLSERTAENHVTHVLNKLGFVSRAQIAAWAVAEGLASRAEIEHRA